jgi:hypothetical protein
LTIVSQPEGALEMLKIEDLSPLTEIAAQNSLVLDILNFTWTNAALVTTDVEAIQKSIDKVIPTLQNTFNGTDSVTFISFLGSLLPKLVPEVSAHSLCSNSSSDILRLFHKIQNGSSLWLPLYANLSPADLP